MVAVLQAPFLSIGSAMLQLLWLQAHLSHLGAFQIQIKYSDTSPELLELI